MFVLLSLLLPARKVKVSAAWFLPVCVALWAEALGAKKAHLCCLPASARASVGGRGQSAQGVICW